MFAQAKCKLPISSQKQNIVAHTHTQKNTKIQKHKKNTFPVNITNLFFFCSCNMHMQYTNCQFLAETGKYRPRTKKMEILFHFLFKN